MLTGFASMARTTVSYFSSTAAAITQQLQASIAVTGTGAVPYFSSRAASVKQHVQRLLSFESTAAVDEDRQSLPPAPDEAAAAVSLSPLQVQSGGQPPHVDTGQEGDSKRIGKSVQTVALFLATASFGLMVTQPARVERIPLLFEIYTTFVYLTLCIGIGLSIYSIVARKGSPKSAWFQKRLMVMGLGFMAAVFVLRTGIVLPIHSLTFVWILFLLIGLLIFFSLRVAWNKNDNDPAAVRHPGDIV